MSNMSEDIQYAGSDTRPPMLDRTDFESWQQSIRLYCLGKDNGENIMKSITEGPFKMGTFIQTPVEETEGALQLGPERARVFTDLSAEEKERYKADGMEGGDGEVLYCSGCRSSNQVTNRKLSGLLGEDEVVGITLSKKIFEDATLAVIRDKGELLKWKHSFGITSLMI
ncbi:hypothetical protein Tco_1026736 [Tanacetum coccineum]